MRVGGVGEGRRALVGGDDEIGVLAVMDDDVLRRHHRVALDIVGDGEQPVDEADIGLAARLEDRVAAAEAGSRAGTKPPLAPTGTMTAFFTCCALTRPSTSVRKSCGRSDQRRPPRATGPKRRCTPSTCGECTKISRNGRGSGTKGSSSGLIFSVTAAGSSSPSAA